MAAPLELSYPWRPAVLVTSVGAILLGGVLLRGRPSGWPAMLVLVGVGWLVLLTVVALRCRAYLAVDGSTLSVRRYLRLVEVPGVLVREVREVRTANGPCYALRLDGGGRPVHVPTALLRRGHRTFFGWLAAAAPQAVLDPRAARTRTALEQPEGRTR